MDKKQDEQDPCRVHCQTAVKEKLGLVGIGLVLSLGQCLKICKGCLTVCRLLGPPGNLRFDVRCKEEPCMALGKCIN